MTIDSSLQLQYYVPFSFKGEGSDGGLAVRESLLNIEGVAIDDSVNKNKWQIPAEDLDFFIDNLQNAQLRVDHAESALAVIGRVSRTKRNGDTAWFRAEIGDLAIIQKVLRGYLSHVSVQVDSDDVECSSCGKQSRANGVLTHLCPGAWEIVHKPKVRELSIVASPAYKNTDFKPVGFAAAMNSNQDDSRRQYQQLIDTAVNPHREEIRRIQNYQDPSMEARKAELSKKITGLQQKVAELADEEDTLKLVRKLDLMKQMSTLNDKLAMLREEDTGAPEMAGKTPKRPDDQTEFLQALDRSLAPKQAGKLLDDICAYTAAAGELDNCLGDYDSFQNLKRLAASTDAKRFKALGLTAQES